MGKKVPLREKLGYGVGAIGLDLSYGLFYSYLSLYLTNALGISSLFLLILAPIARLWDGINDPMMGTCVYFRNDLCSLGYLHIFQTAKWENIALGF